MGRLIETDELLTLIPHRDKMVLIERILDYDTAAWTISSETLLSESNLFYDKTLGGMPNYVLFEFIAQTISALTGIIVRERNLPVNMGFILSVSSLEFTQPLVRAGQKVVVHARRSGEAGSVYSFEADVLVDGVQIGSGNLTVMEYKV